MDHRETPPSHAVEPKNGDEELAFKIILNSSSGERIIARAASAQLAQAIFKAAVAEYPDQRLLLSHDGRVIAEAGKK